MDSQKSINNSYIVFLIVIIMLMDKFSAPCSAGDYMTERGCKECGENSYSGDGASSCDSCPEGKVSSAGSSSVDDCYYGNHDSLAHIFY